LGNCIADAFCDVNLKALVIFDVLKEHGDQAVAELSAKYDVPIKSTFATGEVFSPAIWQD
jgi:hypothetical protein